MLHVGQYNAKRTRSERVLYSLSERTRSLEPWGSRQPLHAPTVAVFTLLLVFFNLLVDNYS